MRHLGAVVSLALLSLAAACDQGTQTMGAGNDFDAMPVTPRSCSNGWLVTDVPRSGWNPRFAFASDGTGHVAYLANRGGDDKVARYVDERTITKAETLPTFGNPAIAVGADGNAAVVVDSSGGGLFAYRHSSNGWQQVGDAFGTFNPSSQPYMAIDAAGALHVSYADNLIFYATDGGNGRWSTAPVGPQNEARGAAIDVDAAGHAHLFYGANEPKTGAWSGYWTSNASGAFVPTPFPMNEIAFADGIDAEGRPHIIVELSDGMHHAWFDAGAWHDEVVATDLASISDLRIDDAGKLHLAGYSKAGLVTYADNVAGSWVSSVVAPDTFQNQTGVWLGLDALGAPHLAWAKDAGFAFAHRCN